VSFLTKGDPGMNRLIKSILAVAMTLVIVIHCDKQAANPEKKTVQFKFQLQYGANAQSVSIPPGLRVTPPPDGLQKAHDPQAFDMVRIMVMDLSAYDSWQDFESTETGQEYMENRNAWNGDRGSWAEWKKFWQDYATIVVDQTLEIQGSEALGTVAGVVGLNEFVAAFVKNSRVRWWVSGEGYGEEGETHDVSLTWWMEVPPLDPCAAVSKKKSPEETVYNAAFGE
jgi:hypothetical protein